MTHQTRRTLLRCGAVGLGTVGLTGSVTGQESQTVATTGPQAVPAVENATISGTTNLPDTATLSIRIRSVSGTQPGFQLRLETTPTDGEWNVTVDLSYVEPGAQFYLLVRGNDQSYVDETWDVVDPSQQFSVDNVELQATSTAQILANTSDGEWTNRIRTVETDYTRTFAVRAFQNGESVFFPEGGSLTVETTGGLEADVDTREFTLTATETGDASVTITIESTFGETYQSPPLDIDVIEPQTTGSDESPPANDSDPGADETNTTTEETTPDTDAQNESAASSSNMSESNTPQQADETADSTPGFTGLGALAGAVAFASFCRQRLRRDHDE